MSVESYNNTARVNYDNSNAEVPDGMSNDQDFVNKVLERFRASKAHSKDWREESEICYDYVSGDQWSDEDKAELEKNLRPDTVMNRVEVFVSAVCGLEALNRNEVQYLPRRAGAIEQDGVTDMMNAAAQYVNDDCEGEVAHSSAFRDAVICGIGFTETLMDYEENPDGDVEIIRREPGRMYWDQKCENRNLKGAAWVMSVEPMRVSDIKATWPDKAEDLEYSRIWDPDWENVNQQHMANEAWKYQYDQSRRNPKNDEEEIYVAHYQYWERETYYRVATMAGIKDFNKEQWFRIRDKAPFRGAPVVTMTRKRFYKCLMAGWTVLEKTPLTGTDFTFQCITGKHDRNKNVWYGLVRPLMSPQMWLNKLFSQILYIIGTNAKGGLLAEENVFKNIQKAEADWSDPSKIVEVEEGAIQHGKIKDRQQVELPRASYEMMGFAMNMFQDVTGANLELLGLQEKVQPGVLEAQRKQAGMTILAWAFDSFRNYRKRHGRLLATFIREYLSDERLIRVTGPEGQQYIPLVRDEMSLEYDVIVNESPESPNERERVLAVLMQLLPTLLKMGIPVPPDLLDYLPLPPKMSQAWKKAINEQKADPQAQQAQQLEMAGKQADIAETHSKTTLNRAKAQSEMMK